VPYEVDGAVEENPPVVRVLAFVEQLDAVFDPYLVARLGQLRELVVGQAGEQAERAKVVEAHRAESIVARPLTWANVGLSISYSTVVDDTTARGPWGTR
jgi:hypothetical protein